jgi:protein MpaA
MGRRLAATLLGAVLVAPATSAATSAPPVETIAVGTSVEGRPITAVRRGDRDGRRVLVIGVIHGDEQAGLQIVELLGDLPVPPGVDLFLVPAMNPDGVAHDTRGNANGVDLNRNFPYNWGPLAQPGDWQYAGPAAASEPETRAITGLITAMSPDLVIWYHQDAFSVAPGQGRDGAIRARYAELTGLPMASVSGGTYTGVAAQWARHQLADNAPQPGVAFIVELGATLSHAEALTHAEAVLTVAGEAV